MHQHTYVVERAQPSDATEIAQVTVDAWRVAYAGIFPQPVLDALSFEHHTAHFEAQLARGTPKFFVCRVHGEVGGWVAIERRFSWFRPRFELSGLYVDPREWRRGIGTALWRHLQALTDREPPREVQIWVVEADARARAFYVSLGFRTDHDRTRVVDRGGHAIKEVAYRGMTAGTGSAVPPR